MDDSFFISRDARMVATELQVGDAGKAAATLREDCAHMNPTEFSQLLRETRANQNPTAAPLAGLTLFRDGEVAVRSQDGAQIPAGQLPPLELARLVAPPCPPPRVEICPPGNYGPAPIPPRVEICPPGQYGPAPIPPECHPGPVFVPVVPEVRIYPERHTHPPIIFEQPRPVFAPHERVVVTAPLNNTTVDTVAGALIGGVIGANSHNRNGAAKGALIGGAAGLILGAAQDNANR